MRQTRQPNHPDLYFDWTRSASGTTNMSGEYRRVVQRVKYLIVDDAHQLLTGGAESTARLIVSELAHREGMVPMRMLPVFEVLEVHRDAIKDARRAVAQGIASLAQTALVAVDESLRGATA